MKKSKQQLTKKQQLIAELLCSDLNIPEAAVASGMARRSIEGTVEWLKRKTGVKYLHGLTVDLLKKGLMEAGKLRKKMR